jgi:uncharacterized membrane protein YpjA
MNKYLKMGLFGLITWLVPFLAGFFFYSPSGELLVNELFFKSVMVVVGAITGAILLVLYFKRISAGYRSEGIVVGVVWLAINLLLDFIVLLPMSGQTIGEYLWQIGLSYLTIPAMSIMAGYVAENANAEG